MPEENIPEDAEPDLPPAEQTSDEEGLADLATGHELTLDPVGEITQGKVEKTLALTDSAKLQASANEEGLQKPQRISLEEVEQMINDGKIDDVISSLPKISPEDHKEVALKLMEADRGWELGRSLQQFKGLDREVFLKMSERYSSAEFLIREICDLEGFKLDKEIAFNLMQFKVSPYKNTSTLDHLIYYFEDFKLDKEVALKAIELGDSSAVVNNLEKFEGLDKEVALALIKISYKGDFVVRNASKFEGLELNKEVALELISHEKGWVVINSADKFTGLNSHVVWRLIDEEGKSYIESMIANKSFDRRELAIGLIKADMEEFLVDNLVKLEGLNHSEISLELIKAGKGEFLLKNLSKFEGVELDKEMALKIIEAGEGSWLVVNLKKFEGLDKDVVMKLIEAGEEQAVVENLEKFEGLDKDIAMKLIEAGKGWHVLAYRDKFKGLSHKEMVIKLIEAGQGRYVVESLERLKGLDHKEVALKLIEAGQGWVLNDYIGSFDKLDLEVAKASIKIGSDRVVKNNPGCFPGAAEEITRLTEIQKNVHLTWQEIIHLEDAGESVEKFEEEDLRDYTDKLIESKIGDWEDEENIAGPFQRGAAEFGYKKMLKYLSSEKISRHDSLHAFDRIVALQRASGLSSNQFYSNILDQVAKDGATYDEGTAYHRLNSIASTLDLDFDKVLDKAGEYDVGKVQELAKLFRSGSEIFASWKKHLQRYAELAQLLERADILQELTELRKQGKEKLYKYVETLAFHPNSGVNMQDVMQFWRHPESFLRNMDDHTPAEVHNRKKPANYVEIPNLDLSAAELRDALVEGKMDALQAFSALEIEYEIPWAELNDVLGEVVRKIKKGEKRKYPPAKNRKELFKELNELIKSRGLYPDSKTPLVDYLKDQNGKEDAALRTDLETAVYGEHGIKKPKESKQVYVAKINFKSDPNGVLAGNDTACCMPFGSGKNNVYMFNPVTSLFTLQIRRPDGTLRTIAQSVLTKDKDIKIAISEIMDKLESAGQHIVDVLPEDVLRESKAYIAADNVEVAPNSRDDKTAKVIEKIYRDYFQEYVKRFGEAQGLHSDKIVIGKAYSDSLGHLPQDPNTFAPLAPVGYSDKTHATVYRLDLKTKGPHLVKKTAAQKPEFAPNGVSAPDIKGVSYLTFEDTLPVAFIEGKAYSDNESLMSYLHNMENALIAKDINNAAKERSNMSLKYVDNVGKVRGYLLAYEGKKSESEGGYDEDYDEGSQNDGEKIIYIADLASDKESKIAGGRLIKGFLDLYKRNYLDKEDFIPIFMEAREATSFRLIKRQFERLSKTLGVEFEMEELPTYQSGGDTMHPLMIRPMKAA